MAFIGKCVPIVIFFGFLLTPAEATTEETSFFSRAWRAVSRMLWMTVESCEEGGGVYVRGTCYHLIDLDEIQTDNS